MRRVFFAMVLGMLAAALLAACGGQPAAPTAAPATSTAALAAPAGDSGLARTDSQASVEFTVAPLNLDAPGETIDFDVSMNTHSVDLNWDLAAQSTLTTDTGRQVQGQSWPGGSGHHVQGTLSFPAKTADGQSLLEGASRMTLVIRDAGTPERTFEWHIAP